MKLQSAQQTLQGAERIHQIESARQWADELKEGTQTLGRRFCGGLAGRKTSADLSPCQKRLPWYIYIYYSFVVHLWQSTWSFGMVWSGCKSAKRLKDWQLSTLRLGGWNMLKRFRRVVRTRRITPIPHMKHPPETMDNNDDTTDDWDITGTMGCMGHGMWISGVGRWICSLVATLMNMIWWLVRGTPPQKYPEPPKLSLVN